MTGRGCPVVLLHGFPTPAGSGGIRYPRSPKPGSRSSSPTCAATGAPTQPDAVAAYSLPLLAGDVLAILAERQISRAHVVGHDWGAALAWVLASPEPEKVDHLVAMSVGNPVTFLRTLEQRQKSWYMLLFQFPVVAERWLTEDNWANFRTWGCHPDADAVIAELEADGSLTPGLNWYRANISPESFAGPQLQLPPVPAPTMGLWSTDDFALTEVQMTDSAKNVTGPWRYERLDGPGHWLQLEAPGQVTALLLDFLPR